MYVLYVSTPDAATKERGEHLALICLNPLPSTCWRHPTCVLQSCLLSVLVSIALPVAAVLFGRYPVLSVTVDLMDLERRGERPTERPDS
jgi:hypothetical protein